MSNIFQQNSPWRITVCPTGLAVQTDDLLTFGNSDITVQRTNVQSFPLGTYDPDQSQATDGIQTYNMELALRGTQYYLTCTPTLPTFILWHSGSAAGGGVSRQILGAAGGIVVGTLAGALAGLPPFSALLVATVTVGVVLLGHRPPRPEDQEGPNTGGDGSSWTAVGGGAGGSGGNPSPFGPAI